jgi:hypothetical protein
LGSFSATGSLGRSDAKRFAGQEFDKYAENDDDEDYDDVFGKANGTGEWCLHLSVIMYLVN